MPPSLGFGLVDPDKLKNYEVGTKGTLLEGMLSYEAAVYYMDWIRVQQTLTVQYNNFPTTVLVNGKSASGTGVDFTAALRPLHDLTVSMNVSWNNLKMDSDVIEEGSALFHAGDRLDFSPEYTAGVSAEYAFRLPIAAGSPGRVFASGNYTSSQTYRTIVNALPSVGQGQSIFLLRAGLSFDIGSHWTASLFGDNLTNNHHTPIVTPYRIPELDARLRPLTVGVQLEYRMQ